MPRKRTVENAISQMTSIDKFITYLMFANGICFRGKPKNYRAEEKIRRMCPPKVRLYFNLENLRRLGVVYPIPKKAHLVALPGFGIRVALKLIGTGEAKKVVELYGKQFPL